MRSQFQSQLEMEFIKQACREYKIAFYNQLDNQINYQLNNKFWYKAGDHRFFCLLLDQLYYRLKDRLHRLENDNAKTNLS